MKRHQFSEFWCFWLNYWLPQFSEIDSFSSCSILKSSVLILPTSRRRFKWLIRRQSASFEGKEAGRQPELSCAIKCKDCALNELHNIRKSWQPTAEWTGSDATWPTHSECDCQVVHLISFQVCLNEPPQALLTRRTRGINPLHVKSRQRPRNTMWSRKGNVHGGNLSPKPKSKLNESKLLQQLL